jgi:glutathione S-transferase
MELMIAVIVFALIEYMFFTAKVGWARGKFGINAPAISGDPAFEVYFRVQQNTLEQLIAFSHTAEMLAWPGYEIASGLGIIWLIGRIAYYKAYIGDPAKRGIGFIMTFMPSAAMLLGTLLCLAILAVR